MREGGLMFRRRTNVSGLRRPISYLSDRTRRLVLRVAILSAFFLGIPAFVCAQSQETQNPLFPGAQAEPPEQPAQTSPGSIPVPQRQPVVTPRITNVTTAQEIAAQGQGLKTKPPKTQADGRSDPDLQVRQLAENALGLN